ASSARGAEESLRDGPLIAQKIPISSGRPGSGVPLAEEAPLAPRVPTRAQRPNRATPPAKGRPLRKGAPCERAPPAKGRPLRKCALCGSAPPAKERPLRKSALCGSAPPAKGRILRKYTLCERALPSRRTDYGLPNYRHAHLSGSPWISSRGAGRSRDLHGFPCSGLVPCGPCRRGLCGLYEYGYRSACDEAG
ncbi:MAG: hypothetical protein ACJAVJ_000666, partial [Planctomycetota bacterium]